MPAQVAVQPVLALLSSSRARSAQPSTIALRTSCGACATDVATATTNIYCPCQMPCRANEHPRFEEGPKSSTVAATTTASYRGRARSSQSPAYVAKRPRTKYNPVLCSVRRPSPRSCRPGPRVSARPTMQERARSQCARSDFCFTSHLHQGKTARGRQQLRVLHVPLLNPPLAEHDPFSPIGTTPLAARSKSLHCQYQLSSADIGLPQGSPLRSSTALLWLGT